MLLLLRQYVLLNILKTYSYPTCNIFYWFILGNQKFAFIWIFQLCVFQMFHSDQFIGNNFYTSIQDFPIGTDSQLRSRPMQKVHQPFTRVIACRIISIGDIVTPRSSCLTIIGFINIKLNTEFQSERRSKFTKHSEIVVFGLGSAGASTKRPQSLRVPLYSSIVIACS